MSYMYVIGACVACGVPFTFNADRVPSVRVTARDGKWFPDPNGSREPICRGCVANFNRQRAERGIDLIPVLDGAYEPEEVP